MPTVEFQCETCKANCSKYARPCVIERGFKPRFCNSKCSGKARLGENHPNFTGGRFVGKKSDPKRQVPPNTHFNCKACGKDVSIYVSPSRKSDRTFEYCSRHCSGTGKRKESHPRWSGGRYQDSEGYWYVTKPEHPAANSSGRVFEHRLVMEAHIGRLLSDEEVIHHRNDDPSDNRIENLQLFANHSEHKKYHEQFRSRNPNGTYAPCSRSEDRG